MIHSLYFKAIVGLMLILFLAIIAFAGTTALMVSRQAGPEKFIDRTMSFHADSARDALQEGGSPALGRYLKRLNEAYPARHFLINTQGKDALDGTDRSDLLARAEDGRTLFARGEVVRRGPSADNHYWLVVVADAGIARDAPYYLWIPPAMVLACLVLVHRLIRPLRPLKAAVMRFGSGDMAVRSGLARPDEIGQLAAEFDRMAEQIERLVLAQRQLLQDVSHELRSPLARLAFALELAANGPDQEGALERARREYRRLTELVTELVELTRAEGDPAAAPTEVVPLHDIVRDVVQDGSVEAAGRDCQIEATVGTALWVPGQPRLLRRAIENVLRNAIRFAPAQTKIEVVAQVQRNVVQIRIRDRGPGVPVELLEAIFSPFFRVGEDRSRDSGGVGLGLAIARRISAVHGGKIEARLGQPGLEVIIELPTRLPAGP
ncbi:MAG TPA: ATP-binding protein [Gemmataceae bacterium]|jgi:two-component system sensor histidine kinase CpxA|nr:ATP-binding protein [Gemmataceae bacterium]